MCFVVYPVLAIIVVTAYQWHVALMLESLHSQDTVEIINIELHTEEIRNIKSDLNAKTSDRFRAKDMERWVEVLREENPNLTIPSLKNI